MAETTNDNSIKFGWRYGGGQGMSVPATSGDYLNRMGSCFVKVSSGVARTLASTDTVVAGWLIMPKETTHGNAVQLTGGDYFVITDPTAVFECPVSEKTASLAASLLGEGCYPVESGGSTTGYKQLVKLAPATCATPTLIIRNVDTTNKSVYVSINPAKYGTG